MRANNTEVAIATLIGAGIVGLICFVAPLTAGLYRRQPLMGIFGAFLCGSVGFMVGCFIGFPVTAMFVLMILNWPEPKRARQDHHDDYDDFTPRQRPIAPRRRRTEEADIPYADDLDGHQSHSGR